MSKFKVGDKVRILDGSKIKNYVCGFAPSMEKYVGKVATITEMKTPYPNGRMGYRLCLDGVGMPCTWDERGLELVADNTITCKFKVGDIVKGTKRSDHCVWTDSKMTRAEVISTQIPDDMTDSGYDCRIRILEHPWQHVVGMELCVKSTEYDLCDSVDSPSWKVVIVPDGDVTTGKLYYGDKLVKEATAKKHPEDAYDRAVAIEIVTNRLLGKDEPSKTVKEEPKKPWNGRVICLDTKGWDEFYTKGKIYEMRDGHLIADSGYKMRGDTMYSFDEWAKSSQAEWMEVVE